MPTPLRQVSFWQAQESALETGVPALLAGTAWVTCGTMAAEPVAGRGLSEVELAVLLGAAAASTGWAAARQLRTFHRRSPRTAVLWAVGVSALLLLALGPLVRVRFASTCADLGGRLVAAAPPAVAGPDAAPRVVCQRGELPGNPYLPGTLVLPAWEGIPSAPLFLWLAIASATGALGLRDVRLRPTRIPRKIADALWLAPAAGKEGVVGAIGPDGAVVACDNPTLWGEPCGQPYAAASAPEHGAWCARCQQPFHADPRVLELPVVSLYSDEVDVLNGLERLDALSWTWGDAPPADPRLSGQERWVELGRVHLPAVLTVAQALALLHDRLDAMGGADDRRRAAAGIAAARASRVCAWLWRGWHPARLTFARPTDEVRFAVGTMRLGDLVPPGSGPVTLQLDVGLLPVEVRMAFRRTFVEPGRAPAIQNTRFDLWLPTGPPADAGGAPGVWVDRVEGDALRSWLATDRIRPADARGVSSPMPYLPPGAPVPTAAPPLAGSLDLVRMPLRDGRPASAPAPGASIAEWAWLQWEQIELLRRESLVLVSRAAAPLGTEATVPADKAAGEAA